MAGAEIKISRSIVMAMIDESGAQSVEEDIVRWLTVLWCKNTQPTNEDGAAAAEIPTAIREARERIDAAIQIGGVPEGYHRSSNERKSQLLKSSIMLPGATKVAKRRCRIGLLAVLVHDALAEEMRSDLFQTRLVQRSCIQTLEVLPLHPRSAHALGANALALALPSLPTEDLVHLLRGQGAIQ